MPLGEIVVAGDLPGSTSRRLIEAAFLRAGLRLEIAMKAGGWDGVQLLSVERIFVGILIDPNPAGLDDPEVLSDRRLKRLRERVDGVL